MDLLLKPVQACFVEVASIVTSFRQTFYAYHQAMKHHHTNIILSLFRIPLNLKCAAKLRKSVYK